MAKESNPIRIDKNGQIVIADRKIAQDVAEALASLVDVDARALRGNSGCTTNLNCPRCSSR